MVEENEKEINVLSQFSVLYRNTVRNLRVSTIRKVTGSWSMDLVVTNNDKKMKNNYLLLQGNINGKITSS